MEREILEFLGRTWSDNTEAEIAEVKEEKFATTVKRGKHLIICPTFTESKLFPSVKDFERWRVWRFGVFHESQHIKHSPAKQLDIIENILEDFRIEHEGLKVYKGYINEQNWNKVVAFARRNKLEDVDKAGRVVSLIEYLLQKTLLPKLKGVSGLPEEDRKWIDEFVKKWHDKVTQTETKYEDTEIFSDEFRGKFKLDELENKKEKENYYGDGEGFPLKQKGEKKMTPKQLKDEVEKTAKEFEKDGLVKTEELKPSELIKEEFEQIKKEKEELKKIEETVKEARKSASIRYVRARIRTHRDYSNVQPVVVRLVSQLQRWKIGWKESLDIYGDELDVEQFTLKEKSMFYDEKKEGVKGKLAIVLDISGSILPLETQYKEMAVTIARALSKLGIKFTMHAFHTFEKGVSGVFNTLYSVKEPGESWGAEQEEKVAGLQVSGGTPTGSALEVINRLTTNWGIEKVIVLTDGQPTPYEEVKKCVELMKKMKRGKEIYWIMLKPKFPDLAHHTKEGRQRLADMYNEVVNEFTRITKEIKPTDYVLIDKVGELPEAFFKIIRRGGQKW